MDTEKWYFEENNLSTEIVRQFSKKKVNEKTDLLLLVFPFFLGLATYFGDSWGKVCSKSEMEKLSSRADFQSSFPGALIEAGWDGGGRERRPSLRDAASWRSAANGADLIIIIKFNWHATPWPIVVVALNGLDFLPGCFPSDRFCFAPRTPAASIRSFTGNGIASLSKMNFPPCTRNFALFVLINWFSTFENCR